MTATASSKLAAKTGSSLSRNDHIRSVRPLQSVHVCIVVDAVALGRCIEFVNLAYVLVRLSQHHKSQHGEAHKYLVIE